ncbi:hypothetical protein DOTSEDRAFT_29731 [Dothistroma septosporum NZE10]|uniref:Uncharacterized protein n=1 Tax=Dothistroma septosporum (strain NZE10 / CBS 128990) TaxID=675120 RepID=M2WHR7_DOTSN|nr:hypothetical protein DOTSEDRAFT_29731 [Dothistroma septosporum NZE10]
MADDTLKERENMSQGRAEERIAWEEDVETQHKILTLRQAIATERTHRNSLCLREENETGDAPHLGYKIDGIDDGESLAQIEYNRPPDLRATRYKYKQVTDEQIRTMEMVSGMKRTTHVSVLIALDAQRRFAIEDEPFRYGFDHFSEMAEGHAAEGYAQHKKKAVVPDEAQPSKHMPAQDWALKHEAVARAFAGHGDGEKAVHHFEGEDTIVINAHSDRHGRTKSKIFAWTTAESHQAAEEGEDLPVSESSNEDSSVDGDSGDVDNDRNIRQAASAATAHLPSSHTFNGRSSALLTTDDDPFMNSPSQGSLNFGTYAQRISSFRSPIPGHSISRRMPLSTLTPDQTLPIDDSMLLRTILKHKAIIIDEGQDCDAADGNAGSDSEKEPPKKKANQGALYASATPEVP